MGKIRNYMFTQLFEYFLTVKVTVTLKNHNKILNKFIFDKHDELNIVKIVFIIN